MLIVYNIFFYFVYKFVFYNKGLFFYKNVFFLKKKRFLKLEEFIYVGVGRRIDIEIYYSWKCKIVLSF